MSALELRQRWNFGVISTQEHRDCPPLSNIFLHRTPKARACENGWVKMIQETIVKFLVSFFKLAPRYFAAIGIACWALLLLSRDTLQKLGLLDFTNNYRPWIAILGVCAVGFILVDLIVWCWRKALVSMEHLKDRRYIKKYLHALTEEEKQILRFYIFHETKTNSLRTDDGVVIGLEEVGIIYTNSVYGSILNGHPFNIAPLAWNYLKKRPYLLDGSTNIERTDKVEWR